MKIYVYELYKTAKTKMLWYIVAFLLVFAFSVFAIQQNKLTIYSDAKSDFEFLIEEYKDIPKETAAKELERKYTEFDIRAMKLKAAADSNYALFLSSYEESEPELYREIMSSEETLSIDELEMLRMAYWLLYENADYIAGYSDYIDSVGENADSMLAMPIFAREGSFTYNNIIKTAEDFEKLKDLELDYGMDKGIVAVTDFEIGDIILTATVFVLCIFIFAREYDNGTLKLVKTCKKGRLPMIIGKLAALATFTALIGMVYTIALYVYGDFLYGFGDTSRYIQSMSSFQNCTVAITVKQFLVYSAISKIAVLIGIGMFFSVIFVLFQSSAALSYIVSVVSLGMAWILYDIVPANAVFNHIKYINPFNFMNTYGLYGKYTNINFFSIPINVVNGFPTAVALVFIICTLISCVLFVKMRETTRKKLFVGIREKISGIWRSRSKSTVLFAEEGFKIFAQGKVLIMLAVVVCAAVLSVNNYRAPTFDVDELVYRKYLRNMSGELTEDKSEYLEEQRAEFEGMSDMIAEYQAQYEAGEITKATLQERITYIQQTLGMRMVGFERAENDVEYAQKNNTWLTDQIAAEAWFGNTEDDLSCGLIFALIAIICLSPVFSIDYGRNVQNILRSTKRGRKPLVLSKLIWSAVIIVVLYICVYVPRHIELVSGYGVPEWNAPIQSIQMFESFGGEMTILEAYIKIHALRMFALIMLAFINSLVSVKVRKQLIIILISTVLFALPVVLQQQGIDLRYLTFNNIFMLSSAFTEDMEIRKAIVNISTLAVIGFISAALTFADSEIEKRS